MPFMNSKIMFGLVDFCAPETTCGNHMVILHRMQPLHWHCYLLKKINIIMKKLTRKPKLHCIEGHAVLRYKSTGTCSNEI